ncbi:hypothetical protein [Tahibacter caeni]|uniref:hypothetical protein n=1 Tax=Tahibacter caeni TaxID=1453545 RepID=UPI002148E78B|nr:hypothetical protein [Tahibacter caeni]
MPTAASNAVPRRVFRNDTALGLWLFVAAWIAMLACFSYIVWRDGGIPQTGRWTWPLLGGFWFAGVGIAGWAAGFPLLRVELNADGLRLRERYPLRATEARYRTRDLVAPRVEHARDDDGDARYDCVLGLPGPRRVVLYSGADADAAQRRCEELAAGLRHHCRGFSG